MARWQRPTISSHFESITAVPSFCAWSRLRSNASSVSEATGRRSFRNSSVTRASSAPPFSSFSPSDSLPPIPLPQGKRRNAGGSVGVLQPLSLVPRRLSQTYKSNLREQIATEIPWRFQALFLFLLLFFFFFYFYSTHAACVSFTRLLPTSTRVYAFLPLLCILIGITDSRKETEVLLGFLNPKLVWSTSDIPRVVRGANCRRCSRLYRRNVFSVTFFPSISRVADEIISMSLYIAFVSKSVSPAASIRSGSRVFHEKWKFF